MTSIPIRRIITVQQGGTSKVAIDEVVEPLVNSRNGQAVWPIFGRDEMTTLPYERVKEYPLTFFPEAESGFRAHVVEFPARSGSDRVADSDAWPGRGLAAGRHVEPDADGMHWTDTVDVAIVLTGEVGLAHDDGTEVVLRPGDIVVQNGAVHAWRLRDVPCQVCFVNLPARRRGSESA